MVVGRRAFASDSAATLIAAIVDTMPPSITTLRPEAPPALARAVARCLAKDPEKRWQSASDLADELHWMAAAGPAIESTPSRERGRLAGWVPALGVVAAMVLGVSGYFYGLSRSTPAPFTYVDDVELPAGASHWAGLAVAPDGRHIAVVTQPARPGPRDPRLWIRETGAPGDWRLISGAGDEIPTYPFWSPDGRSLGFFVNDKLMRLELSSDAPVPVAEATDPRGGAWLDDGTIVFAPTPASGLWKVPAAGGTPVLLLDRNPGEIGLKFPARVDAHRILYWVQKEDGTQSALHLLDLDHPARPKPVVPSLAAGAFDRGHVFFWRDGILLGQRLDVTTGELSGPPARLAVDLRAGSANIGSPNVSAGGGHVAAANERAQLNQLTWVDRGGRVIGEISDPLPQARPELSPDGKRLVIERRASGQEGSRLWLQDLESGSIKPLTSGGDANFAMWSPDGTQLLFRSLRGSGGNGNLYRLAVDDPGRVDPVVEANAALWPAGWLPQGNGIAFTSTTAQMEASVPFPHGLLVETFGEPPSVFRSLTNLSGARLSPDGTRFAFMITEGGRAEVFVDTFPKPGVRPVQVSRGGGVRPLWRGDGQELYFQSANRMMVLPMPAGSPPGLAQATPLFVLPPGSGTLNDFAVSADGSRFLLVVPTIDASGSVKLTLNWKAEQ
jgi:Tol biopolymer transport system component